MTTTFKGGNDFLLSGLFLAAMARLHAPNWLKIVFVRIQKKVLHNTIVTKKRKKNPKNTHQNVCLQRPFVSFVEHYD